MDTTPPHAERRRGSVKLKGHLTCPFCNSYDVGRMYLASVNLDSCHCTACGAGWDEECGSGEYGGRSHPASVLMPRID